MNRGWLISGLRLENPQKQNRPKTKNYITEGHKKIQKQDVATPLPSRGTEGVEAHVKKGVGTT